MRCVTGSTPDDGVDHHADGLHGLENAQRPADEVRKPRRVDQVDACIPRLEGADRRIERMLELFLLRIVVAHGGAARQAALGADRARLEQQRFSQQRLACAGVTDQCQIANIGSAIRHDRFPASSCFVSSPPLRFFLSLPAVGERARVRVFKSVAAVAALKRSSLSVHTSSTHSSGVTRQRGELSAIVLVATLGPDRLAAVERDLGAADVNRLAAGADEMHLDATVLFHPGRAMHECIEVEIRAELVVEAREQVEIECGGNAGRIVVGGFENASATCAGPRRPEPLPSAPASSRIIASSAIASERSKLPMVEPGKNTSVDQCARSFRPESRRAE